MRKRRMLIALVFAAMGAVLLGGAALAATVGGSETGGRPFTTVLTGEAEVPGPGDPDGSGTAAITVNPGQRLLCYEIEVSGIVPANAAHVHEAPADDFGPVVVGLTPPTGGTSSGCASIPRELAREIVKNPDNYYVNVHNEVYPMGALRGQLSR